MIQPDAETFRANVMSTYHVIEAATTLGVRKIVIASSETTYGVCFADGDKDFACFPLEEDYAIDPMDSYGLSKVRQRADGARLRAADGRRHLCPAHRQHDRAPRVRPVPGLPGRSRCRASATPGATSTPATSGRSSACAREGRARLPGLQCRQRHDHGRLPTQEFLARYSPGRADPPPLGGFEAPISNRKVREVLGFREAHDWRKREALGVNAPAGSGPWGRAASVSGVRFEAAPSLTGLREPSPRSAKSGPARARCRS